ncbi:prefoldin domain-containing protein [Streptomyces sp. NPDC002057]|uniref:prefoldin domain-containing protein n=1 Tax=Streptomyces sp. NPDC002057 TaxID=3154664 RepID=UPI00332EDFDF
MAISDRLLGYAGSRKNLTGCVCGLAGVGVTLTGAAGGLWPLVVAGLYAAGALIAPPERPDTPEFPGAGEQLDALRADFATLRAYLAEVELPPAAREALDRLDTLVEALLEPGWVSDPEHLHVLARAVRQDVPEAVDTFVRTRWWSRFTSGAEDPESHLGRQLAALHEEAAAIATALREAEAIRQRIHTRYVEERGG